MKLYAERDPEALEPHLFDHMMAMTAEGLHSKGAIACELAWRDQQIERLEGRLKEIAEIAHAGGLKNMSENRALTEIRKLSLEFWRS